jgi:phosphate-selective porin OprO/OprP
VFPKERNKVRLFFLFAIFFCNFGIQWAQTSAVEMLEKRIELMEAELLSLKKELLNIKADRETEHPETTKVAEKKKAPFSKSISIGGRLMYDQSFLSADPALENAYQLNTRDSSEFRRARVRISGKQNERISWALNYDFGEANAKVKNTYIKYTSPSGKGFRVGHSMEFLGLENITSSRYITFMERSLLKAFYPSYNSGFFYMDENRDHQMSWAVSLTGDTEDDGHTGMRGESTWNITSRWSWDSVYKNEGKDYTHFGVAFSRRNTNGGSISFGTTPESHLWNNDFPDTGNMIADYATLAGFEFLWNRDRLSFQSEYIRADVQTQLGSDPGFSGWYVFASYFLTKDHRPYNRAYRMSARVKPNHDYISGGRGAWQLSARYSSLDLNDKEAGILGGEMDSATLGLNWYLTDHTRLMWNYVISDLEGTGQAESLNIRYQIDF